MYNIEEKIKAWFKNNVWNPVISSVKNYQEEIKEKKKEEENQEKKATANSGITIYSDEELEKQAKDSLIDEYNLKKSNLKKDLDLNTERLYDKSQEKIKNVESQKDDVEDYYATLNKKTVNDSVKQGISRSSIVDGQIDKNNSDKEKEIKGIEREISDILSSNQKDVDYYGKKYENSLDSLDAQFDIDVKEKFKKLKADQDKRIEEYNKEQEKIEEDNKNPDNNGNVDGEDKFDEEEYHKLVEKYKDITLDEINLEEFNKLNEEDKIAVRQAVFDEILAYYYSMTPKQAKEAYKNDTRIKEILGSYTKVLERYLDSYN